MRVTLVQKRWGGDHQKRQRLQGVAPSCISYILRAFQSTTTMRHKRKRSSLLMRLVFAHRASQTYLTPSPDDKGHQRASVMTYYVFQTVWHQKDSEWHRVRMTSKLESLKSLWLQQTHVTRGLSRFSSLSGWGVHSNRWRLFMCQAELLTYNEHNKSSFVLFGLFQNVDAFVVCSPWSCLVSFGVVKKEIISCNFWKLSHHSFPAAAFRAVHVESNPPVRMHPKYSCTSQQLLRLTALQFVDTHPSAGSLLRCSTSATGSRKTHLVKF